MRFGDIEIRTKDDGRLDEIVLTIGDTCVVHFEDMGGHFWATVEDLTGHRVSLTLGPDGISCDPADWHDGEENPEWSFAQPWERN